MEEDQIKRAFESELENVKASERLKSKVLQSVGILEIIRSLVKLYTSIPNALVRKVRDKE